MAKLWWLLSLSFAYVSSKQQKPNIVFILADDLGWNDVGFHGSNEMRTPNLDALAYNGIILNGHYSESLCTPSRSALLTGRYPIHTGTQHNVIVEASPWGLPLKEKLMPQYLNKLGYESHGLGKWHLGYYKKEYTPTYRGFKSFYGFWNSHQDYFSHIVQATFSPFEGLDIRENMTIDWHSNGKYTTRLLTDKAETLIREHETKKPLFLYVSHQATHAGNYEDPLQAPEETIQMFSHLENKEKQLYAAMTWELDQSIGRIVRALNDKGILNNTIIVFVSDNGAPTRGLHKNTGSNWPLKGEKSTPWEGGIRSVACLWAPQLPIKNVVLNNLMHISDWLPTLYTAAGGHVDDLKNIDGRSHWDFINFGGPEPRYEILHNIDDFYGYSALRLGPFKYVNGSVYLGYLDGWHGIKEKSNQTYDTKAILESEVNQIFSGNEYSNLSESLISDLRQEVLVKCKINERHAVKCDSRKAPCLFNIIEDPCEKHNVYEINTIVVLAMEVKLEKYRAKMIPPGNKKVDSSANPKYYNNTWINWGDYKTSKSS